MLEVFKSSQDSAAINATNSQLFPLTLSTIERYGACRRLMVQNNNATVTVIVYVNAAVLGDNSIQEFGNCKKWTLPPSSVLEITPEDNIPFYNVVVKNTHAATNMAAKDIFIQAQNQ